MARRAGRSVYHKENFKSVLQIHAHNLSYGLYLTYGTRTCMGFAGTWTDEQIANDAQFISDAGADYLKFDGCFNKWEDLERGAKTHEGRKRTTTGYLTMRGSLLKLPTNIAYACSWPFYLLTFGMQPNYTQIAEHCNVWRNFNDIELNWQSVLSTINFYTQKRDELSRFHGPQHWNDPDMVGVDRTTALSKYSLLQLIIGNNKLTTNQERAQMSFWCMWSAPLIMSNDLTEVPAESKQILLNQRAIRIDQDPAGDMAARVDVVCGSLLDE